MSGSDHRIRHVALALACMISCAPLAWMLWTSFKQPGFGTSLDLLGPASQTLGPYEAPPEGRFLRFQFRRAGTDSVAVAGSFNDWQPAAMHRHGWEFRLDLPAKPGRYEYKFVVDGNLWLTDPENPPEAVGGNSVIVLLEDQPLAINSPRVLDRSFREAGRIIPVVHAPDAASVTFDPDRADTSWLSRKHRVPTLQKVSAGPDGATVPGHNCYTMESGKGLALGKYSITLTRSFGARFRALYTMGNYREVVEDPSFPFGIFFLNSLVVALGAALATTVICTLGGYAFATKEFRGKTPLFQLLMASMMVPGMIYMVPQYAVVTRLGWINSYMGMIVPHLANVFGLLLMTNYIRGLPKSLFEAARVDGATEPQILRHVLFPLSMPAMATLFVLTFMGQWSNFLWQLIVNTPDSAYRTLPVGLALFKGQYDLKVEAMMAAAAFSVIPVSIVFFFTQKRLIEGLTSGSVKE